jgi:hypothetical protein
VLVVLAAALLVLTPWMIRNYKLVGAPIATASVGGVAAHAGLYICQKLTWHNEYQALDFEAAAARAQLARQQGYRFIDGYDLIFYDPHDELRFSNLLSRQVLEEYRRSPALFAECAGENVFNYWFAGKNWTSTLLNIPVQLACLLLAVWGALTYWRARGARLNWQMRGLRLVGPTAAAETAREAPGIGLYVLFCAYSMLVYVPIHAQARYSIPTVPLLALIAAAGVAAAARRVSAADGSEATSPVRVARS